MNTIKLLLKKAGRTLCVFLFLMSLLLSSSAMAQYNQSVDACQGDPVTLDFTNGKPNISFIAKRDTLITIKNDLGNQDTIFIFIHVKPYVKAGVLPVLCNDTSAIDLSNFGSKLPLGGKGIWYLSNKPVAVVNNTLYPDLLSAGHYTLTYTVYDRYNCRSSDTSTLIIRQCKVVSVQEQASPFITLKIFPNPTSGIVYLKFAQSINTDINCTVTNIYGVKLMSMLLTSGISEQNINVSTLPCGVYMLMLKAGDSYVCKSIIKD